jgi:hypothetical protein
MAQSCSAAVTTRWQQLRLATALRQVGSPPTSGSFEYCFALAPSYVALPPPIPAKNRYSDDQHARRVRSAGGDGAHFSAARQGQHGGDGSRAAR